MTAPLALAILEALPAFIPSSLGITAAENSLVLIETPVSIEAPAKE